MIRVLPNTPMLVGEGCSIFCPGRNATREDIELLQIILNTSGISEQVPENMINPIGALSGSGPAFVSRYLSYSKIYGNFIFKFLLGILNDRSTFGWLCKNGGTS